jgi:hypothetical protein
MDEKMATAVYGHCLAKVIGSEGVKIPEKALAIEKDLGELISEVVK